MIHVGNRECDLCGNVCTYGLQMQPRGKNTVTICLRCLNNTIKPIILSENEEAKKDGYKEIYDNY